MFYRIMINVCFAMCIASIIMAIVMATKQWWIISGMWIFGAVMWGFAGNSMRNVIKLEKEIDKLDKEYYR